MASVGDNYSSAPADNSCKDGDGTYDFQVKQGGDKAGPRWRHMEEQHRSTDCMERGGKSGVAFGVKYEVKSLPVNAPACKGNANCVRLATVPDGKDRCHAYPLPGALMEEQAPKKGWDARRRWPPCLLYSVFQ